MKREVGNLIANTIYATRRTRFPPSSDRKREVERMRNKSLVFFVIIIIAFSSVASGAGFDTSSFSESELRRIVTLSRAQIFKLENFTEESKILLSENGVYATTLKYEISVGGDFSIEVFIENQTEYKISLVPQECAINDWMVEGYGDDTKEIPAGKFGIGRFVFYDILEDAEITSINELESVEFVIRIASWDNNQDLYVPIHLEFKEGLML